MGLGAMVGKSPMFMGYFYGINGIYIYILWIYGYMDIFMGYHYEIYKWFYSAEERFGWLF